MGLREEAISAAEDAHQARVETTRRALASVLAPADVSELEVADDLVAQVVFTDDTVSLAVDQAGKVTLVRDSGGWTRVGEVTSLAGLGLLLTGGA